jgi:hypothetical protein
MDGEDFFVFSTDSVPICVSVYVVLHTYGSRGMSGHIRWRIDLCFSFVTIPCWASPSDMLALSTSRSTYTHSFVF